MTESTVAQIPRDGLSHVLGASDEPLLNVSVGNLLVQAAERYGQREAAVFAGHDVRWSYTELLSQVDSVAQGLHAIGVVAGERVGIWCPNRPEWLLAQFATARLGAILVAINPAYRLSELEFALNKVNCKAVITAERFKSSDYIHMLQELAPELSTSKPGELHSRRIPSLRSIIKTGSHQVPGMYRFEDMVAAGVALGADSPADTGSGPLADGATSVDDVINIQFTSGTTGFPKGAALSHRNIVNNANFVMRAMDFSEADRLCIPVPFYHCFGMVMGTLGCVTQGATMVIPGEGFDPLATLQTVEAERCSALYAVPTMFTAMLDHPEFQSFDLSALRTGIMAGAPCPIEIMRKVQSLMHMKHITIAYGMTETSPVSFQSSIHDSLSKRVSSVGRVHPHVEVKLVDADGHTVPVGQQGELLTRGYSVMREYWGDEQHTKESIDQDGWMHTGDLAVLDEAGYCNITGRLKDMIVRGGENIYPREVEEFLYRLPAVSQVQVFGIPDRELGESVCAWIVLRDGFELTESEVIDFCREQIAHYKVPARVCMVESMPMTVTGKAQKFRMREEMICQLGIEEIDTA